MEIVCDLFIESRPAKREIIGQFPRQYRALRNLALVDLLFATKKALESQVGIQSQNFVT